MNDVNFPFGAPSTPRPPRLPTKTTELFVLGVYPSALHVRWTPPTWAQEIEGVRSVGALAVADEPTVFWDGIAPTPADLVDAWKQRVGFLDGDAPGRWGRVSPAGNGTSGRPVLDRVLGPLGISAESTWFSDCVNTFFVKSGKGSQGDAWRERYAPFAAAAGCSDATIPQRPSANELVTLAIEHHVDRLRAELLASNTPRVVTLGEEARRVLAEITDESSGAPMQELTLQSDAPIGDLYGQKGRVHIGHWTASWMALVHPGQRSADWAAIHAAWIDRQRTAIEPLDR